MALTKEEYDHWKQVLKDTKRMMPPAGDPKTVQRDADGYPTGMPYSKEVQEYLELASKKEISLYAGGKDFKVYRFDANHKCDKPRVYVNIHGGGWAIPHEENDFYFSAYFAELIGGIVIDVDYTVSTEAPFNTMHAQCMEAVHYTFAHCEEWGCDRSKITVGGYSAGGHLTWGVALKCRQEGLPLYSAICAYTPFNMSKKEYPENAQGIELRSQAFDTLLFANEEEQRNTPYGNPVSSTDEEIKMMPAMMIISAEQCPFRDEDEQFASKIISMGVPVSSRRYNTSHGFIPHFLPCWHDAAEAMRKFIVR